MGMTCTAPLLPLLLQGGRHVLRVAFVDRQQRQRLPGKAVDIERRDETLQRLPGGRIAGNDNRIAA
jgi:hypothetical protein